jgi:uncharacterized protein (DUF1684 family)
MGRHSRLASLAIGEESVRDVLDLLDWKRQVFALYAEVRAAADPVAAWNRWCAVRGGLYRDHPQSPRRGASPAYFPYDPAWRVLAELVPVEPETRLVAGSGPEPVACTRFALARFAGHELELFWLEAYGGGLFLPFRDGTSGNETYGGGRYLLDTVKGADLGTEDGQLVLDFNFAYSPSCAWDPRWACPLSPPANRLADAVRAGERKPEEGLEPTTHGLQNRCSTN